MLFHMKLLKPFFGVFCFTIALAGFANAKSWRGVRPLHSTLANVIKRFGPCTRTTENSCIYDWKRETVIFFFLSETCGVGENSLPPRTVIRIGRRPKVATRLPDYTRIDFAHFSAFRLPEGSNRFFENYIDDDEGFAAEIEQGSVTQVHYTAPAAEIDLCPSSYIKPSDLLPKREEKIVTEFFGPLVGITCPKMTVEPDEPITFSASLAGGFPYMKPTYTWTISAGRISRGQGTPAIRVITNGLPDDTEITATLIIGGTGKGYKSQASCTSTIHPYRVGKR
jgi:hypothetical protein